MQARFHYALTKDEYVVGLVALTDQLGRQDDSRTRRIIEQLGVMVVVMFAISIAYPAGATGLLIAALLITLLYAFLGRRWLRGATGQSYDSEVAEQDVEIADEGIFTRSPIRDRRWTWEAVRRIHDLEQAIVLQLAGWDMIVLPNRLWDGKDERRAFLDGIRGLATNAGVDSFPVKSASFDRREVLSVGAIAAGVDALGLIVFNLPMHRGPTPPTSDAAFLGVFAALLLLGLVLSYLAYRLARKGLERLHDSSPTSAIAISHALVWVVPAYILVDYLGWV